MGLLHFSVLSAFENTGIEPFLIFYGNLSMIKVSPAFLAKQRGNQLVLQELNSLCGQLL